MNAMAEALGMSLTGCSAIPAPFRERMNMAYETGKRIVQMAHEELRPSKIMTREAFINAIVVNTAIGGSTNAPPHLQAIARHVGVELNVQDWQDHGFDKPLLVNMQPAGEYLGEGFFLAGGVPAVMGELDKAGMLNRGVMTVTGKTMGENLKGRESVDHKVIKTVAEPLRKNAGFVVVKGNLFDSAVMKTSVISQDFRERYLSKPGEENVHTGRAVVFEGPEHYHAAINEPGLQIDANSILFIRGVGCVGYPGSAEVVNMQPPDSILKQGIKHLPTVGDGRQSGTSESPSILNASPESVVGGGLAYLQTGDTVRLDLNEGTMNALVAPAEWAARKAAWKAPEIEHQTPWQQIYRENVGQLADGGCLELATSFQKIHRFLPRDNH
jgi:dihydroxyacid dehydratase/phosphogluconate dehydratase